MDFGWSFELKNVIICINTKHLWKSAIAQ
jgi:hypothetical protein